MKKRNSKLVKKIVVLSMVLSTFGAIILPSKVMAMEASNSTLKVSTDKSIIDVGDEVVMKVAPLRYEFGEEGLLGINIKVIADFFQEAAEIQSIELPRTYYINKDGEKVGSIYYVRSVNYEEYGVESFFPVDSTDESIVVSREELLKQHNNANELPKYFNIMVRIADENGESLSNMDSSITEIFMEDEIKVTYKINDSGKSYKDSTYIYAYAEMDVQVRDYSSKQTYAGKTVLFSNTDMTYTDYNDHIHYEDINSGKILLENSGNYKNTRLALRIISEDIEVVSDNFVENESLEGVYDNKVYVNVDEKQYKTLLPGEKIDVDFDYKLKNKDLQAGDIAKYRIIFYQDAYSGAIDEYLVELVVTDEYTLRYKSEKYHEYLLEDENNYKITDEVIIDGVDDLPLDHDFIGWQVADTDIFVEEGETIAIKDLIVDGNEITLNAVYEDKGYSDDIDKDDNLEDKGDIPTIDDDQKELEDDNLEDKENITTIEDDQKEFEADKKTVNTGVSNLLFTYKFIILLGVVFLAKNHYNLRKVKKI